LQRRSRDYSLIFDVKKRFSYSSGLLICFSFVFKKHVFTLYKQRFMAEIKPESGNNGAEEQPGSSKKP